MKYLDLTLGTPEENLATDEALLDLCEEEGQGGLLRVWEPAEYFAVLGYANRFDDEIALSGETVQGIPVLRRCSGGGAVLQGPGCLNYALFLEIQEDGPLASISGTNCKVMEQHRSMLGRLLSDEVRVLGHSDLVFRGLKCSGNAQRRRRRYLLFHGTFLLDFAIELMGCVLKLPLRRPEYRADRAHRDFVGNIGIQAESLKAGLRESWGAWELFNTPSSLVDRIRRLVGEKYSRPDWNRRF